MTTGVAPRSAFAAITAPRKLQSLGATVQAEAAATSSVRSTSSVVTNIGIANEASAAVTRRFNELEDAVLVYLSVTAAKTASVNSERAICLFMVVLQVDGFS